MKHACLYCFIFICITVFSCSSRKTTKIQDAIEGIWVVDTIIYKNYNIKPCVLDNIISFKFGKKSTFPVSDNYCAPVIKNNFDEFGNIELVSSETLNDTIPFRVKITRNKVFGGTYRIIFYKDIPHRSLTLQIWSDNVYMVCRKELFTFDDNIELMDKLEKATWTNR